jgi:putative oxidoreductase
MDSRLESKIEAFANHLQSPLLLAIRLFWGGSFFVTGIGKFTHMDKIVDFFHSIGIPYAAWSAFITASIETMGGAFLFLGLASRVASIPLLCTMIVAFGTAETEAIRMIVSNPQNFIHRDPFSFFFASLIIFAFGPGNYSLDSWLWTKQMKSSTQSI